MDTKGKKKSFNIIVSVICMLLCCILLCSCSHENTVDSDKPGGNTEKASEKDKLRSFVENKYGIADSTLYGSQVTHITSQGGGQSSSYETSLNESSNGGAVFYKTADTEEYPNTFVCAYISDEYQEGYVRLVINHYQDYIESSGGISFPILWDHDCSKSRCYVAVVNDLLVCVSMEEGTPVFAEPAEEKEYEEKITVYDMSADFDSESELFMISRKLTYRDRELKDYFIQEGEQRIRYTAGYDYYAATEDERVTTQQEFCDRANKLLADYSINFISLEKSSWNNKWFGMSVDESSVGTDMVKVDFTLTDADTDANGDKVQDMVIEINKEKEETAEDEFLEEVDDTPIDYYQKTEQVQVPEANYFNIDGFWHSADYKYVYHIYTQSPDNGFGTLYYADLEGDAEAKHGTVQQISSSSMILKAMEDDGFSPEVHISNNQLVSDEITLVKADDRIAFNLTGVWSDDDKTYTFDADGTYEVKTSDDWYWGRYFIIDESQIVLGEHNEDLKVYDYSLEGNSFVLNERVFVRQ